MAFYPTTNLYPSPRPYQPGMIPPPLAVQPYTPTPPMGMNPFTPSSVDPLVMHSALQPPPPIISPPGGTPLDMRSMPPPIAGPLPPPRFIPGFIPKQLDCWSECVGCLAITLCCCFLCDDYDNELDQPYIP